MASKRSQSERISRARELRQKKTVATGLLWSILRNSQLCGMKFRREHPIDRWYVDFACVAERLVVEVDGGYHDEIAEEDLEREAILRSLGWEVIRFTNQEVQADAESVGRAIAKAAGKEYSFAKRRRTGSGIKSFNARPPKQRKPR